MTVTFLQLSFQMDPTMAPVLLTTLEGCEGTQDWRMERHWLSQCEIQGRC